MKLRKRLFRLFTLLVVLMTFLNFILTYAFNQSMIDSFTREIEETYVSIVLTNLKQYYQLNGSWEGINPGIVKPHELPQFDREWEEKFGEKPPNVKELFPKFALTDEQGRVVIGKKDKNDQQDEKFEKKKEKTEENEEKPYPVLIGGRQVGTLWVKKRENPLEVLIRTQIFIPLMKANMFSFLVIALVALLLANIFSKKITLPLDHLAEAAKQIADGQWEKRVKVNTRDEIEKLAISFNQMAEKLEIHQKQRKKLQGDIAHELRTPLTIMQNVLDSLEAGILTWNQHTQASLQEEISRLERLINDLRNLSLAESGQLVFQKELIYLEDLLQRLEEHLTLMVTTSGVHMEWLKEGDLTTVLYLDSDRMMQVFINLIQNALRHTQPGGKISFIVHTTKNEVVFQVKDTGEGIQPQHLPFIFDRFYRADPSRRRKTGASGLGLAIVKEFVQAHNGSVEAESKPGTGTTVTVVLPVAGEEKNM